MEDLRVYPTRCSQEVIDRAVSVKAGTAELLCAYIDVEPVGYNRGFYTVDVRYFYRITADAFVGAARPVEITGLVVFLVFHLFLYVFNFQPEEALQLKDYARYIGPYYVGVAFMLLGQLALAAKPQARLVQVGLAAVLCILFVWRGMPLAGFWNYPHTIYSVRDDVKSRAEQVNDLLNWEDTVLLISQGDDVTRWNYYGFDLNATLAKGFAGNGYGPQLEEGTDWWMTTHMNLVDPNSQQSMYAYSTLCTPEDLKRFLQDMRYDYILVDESDEYIAQVIGPAFGVNDLPDQRTDQVILLRVEYTGDTVRWVRQEGVTP